MDVVLHNELTKSLSASQMQMLNDLSGFLSFKPNFVLRSLLDCDAKIIFVETGNQMGKTATICMYYILRIMGKCKNEKKNITPNTKIRTIRFASETLPTETDGQGEAKNTIYPQFKKFLPPSLIKKDITIRKPVLTLRDPQGGPDIYIEFVSYNQDVQSQAGVQRLSVFEDEEPRKSFHEEQIPRLLAADGDLVLGLTPVTYQSWSYEDLYQKARVIYNSPTIIKYLQEKTGITHKTKEYTDSKLDIAVIRAATDDNPTLTKETIDEMYSIYDDESTVETRRYGIFHQMSGTIFKEFGQETVISGEKYFPQGMPHGWLHARGIDFHTHVNWACGWVCLSDQNEAFIYREYNPSPDRNVTLEIARNVIQMSGDQKFKLNLVDPTMSIKQPNTGYSALDDFNRFFLEFKRDGMGTGGYWETWDTKNERGRDIIKERFKNSRLVGKPFNNRIVKNGVISYLPTLWVLDNCHQTIYSFKNWRWEQWASRESVVTKEEKNKAEDKHSHFPITFECVFKDVRFSVGRFKETALPQRESAYNRYFRSEARL